jgi:hypothetical protein
MKKINTAIAVMSLLFVFLVWGAVERKAVALTCQDLSECCGAAGCSGPGTVSGCSIVCAGGGSVTCARKVGDRCVNQIVPVDGGDY